MQSLQHDAAMRAAQLIVGLVGHLLREEEQKDMIGEVYDILMAALRRYEDKAERRTKRLGKP